MPHLHLSDFKLGSVLGVGTVGTIYDGSVRDDIEVSATAKALVGKAIAIKKLHPAICSDELIQARFRREMLILERLQHPNIIGYHGGGSENGQLFYVMQRVDGGTIKDLLEATGRLVWPVVVDVSRQVSSALQCAHNHGVIHRDLKPGNLFLTRDAQVKLGDFGIARDQHSADLTDQGLTVGTHAYMAPEQIVGETSISGKVDLYALGCCMFEMLTGRKVFLGENFAQLFEQHLRSTPPRVSTLAGDVPPELDEVINACLAKRPDDRPFNARAVQGVMLEIGEKYGLGTSPEESAVGQLADEVYRGVTPKSFDVGAGNVTEKGRLLLEQQIQARIGGTPREAIAPWKIAVLLLGLVLVIGLAAILAN
ncbi:serine/threonine protein kinase [Aporhodopirellula aestuarii]|uniref:Serine/threonine protein kinase n=1 Tax=Aporhodopirellula aestuarii TaxID=2950107 RepID=A0ABT0UAA3_9BACT|nr:serine/threonine-protein kinase [Aporhodopirellula aestuarii]MCM2373271.1 serine/threonine protein kinase [Aporhodopirellula aestuarii]